MRQLYLDLMNYDRPADPSQYADMQDFLCNAPKTDGRFGFNPTSRFSGGDFAASAVTPYGMQVMESQFIQVVRDFGVFNYEVLKRLCESPLPDASVLNIVDNAVYILQEAEEGELTEFVMTHVGHINPYGIRGKELTWSKCGCDCLIEWAGRCKRVSLNVADMLQTTGRLRVIPLAERMSPRDGSVHELAYYPHPNPVTWRGEPITKEMIDGAREDYRNRPRSAA